MRRTSDSRRERGVVLFIALIVMAALSLAGIALIRATDTATIATGNLALKQAAVAAVDRSVEQTVHAIWDTGPAISNTSQHLLAQNYFSCVQAAAGGACLAANSKVPEVPAVLASPAAFAAAGLSTGLVQKDAAGNTSYFVIERMCLNAGPPLGNNCNLSSGGFGQDAGTQHYVPLDRPGNAYFRVTVMVTGPRNTVAYAQAMLQ